MSGGEKFKIYDISKIFSLSLTQFSTQKIFPIFYIKKFIIGQNFSSSYSYLYEFCLQLSLSLYGKPRDLLDGAAKINLPICGTSQLGCHGSSFLFFKTRDSSRIHRKLLNYKSLYQRLRLPSPHFSSVRTTSRGADARAV